MTSSPAPAPVPWQVNLKLPGTFPPLTLLEALEESFRLEDQGKEEEALNLLRRVNDLHELQTPKNRSDA